MEFLLYPLHFIWKITSSRPLLHGIHGHCNILMISFLHGSQVVYCWIVWVFLLKYFPLAYEGIQSFTVYAVICINWLLSISELKNAEWNTLFLDSHSKIFSIRCIFLLILLSSKDLSISWNHFVPVLMHHDLLPCTIEKATEQLC